jgi:hypothetical protein
MKEIVLKYLDETYRFTLSTYISYKLRDKYKDEDVSLKEVFTQIETIFGLPEEKQREIFDEWADIQAVKLNNIVVDIQEKLYLKTGKEINVPVEEMNDMVAKMIFDNSHDDMIRKYM